MRPTICDVAKLAKVSKATVSRVINHHDNVSKETRDKVIHAIRELGFHPNVIARNLSNQRTNNLGVILPDISNPFFPTLARGIEDAARRLGHTIFMCNSDNDEEVELELISKMIAQQVAGIMLISTRLSSKKVHSLTRYAIPFVLCSYNDPTVPFDTVSADHYRACYEAINYLIKQGHQQISYLAGPSASHTAALRLQAYVDAMTDARLPIYFQKCEFTFKSGYQQTRTLLEKQLPTAIFTANDLIALGAIRAIEEIGLSVPYDISIIGYDNIQFAQMSKPLLTTVAIPAYQLGVVSVECLNNRLKEVRGEINHITLPYQLVIRESCKGR